MFYKVYMSAELKIKEMFMYILFYSSPFFLTEKCEICRICSRLRGAEKFIQNFGQKTRGTSFGRPGYTVGLVTMIPFEIISCEKVELCRSQKEHRKNNVITYMECDCRQGLDW
jgi:hypothetical protein